MYLHAHELKKLLEFNQKDIYIYWSTRHLINTPSLPPPKIMLMVFFFVAGKVNGKSNEHDFKKETHTHTNMYTLPHTHKRFIRNVADVRTK